MRTEPDRQERFLELVRPHRRAIAKVAALYARDSSEREDLAAEVMLQLWRCFERFRGESSFSTFLYRVALNTALLWARRAAGAPRVDAQVAVEELGQEPSPGVDDEDVRRLYAAVRELRPIDRALVLLALEERSHREIAEVTGLSTENVGVRLSRCRAQLRERMRLQRTTRE